jgi:hypothetical protein
MRRSLVLLVLLAAAGLGFARAEQLKLELSPVGYPEVATRFSLTCVRGFRCDGSHRAQLSFVLRRPARVSLAIVRPDGRLVRLLGPSRLRPKGRVRAAWDGRTDAGARVPDGSYRLRVGIGEGREITIPSPIVVDDVAPRIEPLGRGDPLRYRVSEAAAVRLAVWHVGPGRTPRKPVTYYRPRHGRIHWDEDALRPGTTVLLVLRAADAAGNRSSTRLFATAR